MSDIEFQKRLCMAQCEYGSKDFKQYVNLPLDHGIYFQDTEHPLLNANDYEADKHILQFGRCTSKVNPGNIVGDVLAMTCPLFGLAKLIKKAVKCEGCKCKPKTLTAWQNTDQVNHIDGVDGITSQSFAMCFYGGKITIVKEDPPADAPEDGGDESKEKKSAIERMPSSAAANVNANNNAAMQNYANNMNTAMPEGATDAQGCISDASMLGGYSCGNNDLTQPGNSCVATYNAAVAMNSDIPFEDMILANDVLGVYGGSMSDSMQVMQTMYESMGYYVSFVPDPMFIPKGSVAIVGADIGGSKNYASLSCSDTGEISWLGGYGMSLESTDGYKPQIMTIQKENPSEQWKHNLEKIQEENKAIMPNLSNTNYGQIRQDIIDQNMEIFKQPNMTQNTKKNTFPASSINLNMKVQKPAFDIADYAKQNSKK